MKGIQGIFAFLGRACISSIFILSSVQDLFDWTMMEQYATSSLNNLISTATSVPFIQTLASLTLTWLPILFVLAVIMKFLGGVLVLLGLKVRFGATLLILFLIPITVLMHPFWMMDGAHKPVESIMFWKNIAILGGLFLLLSTGKGSSKSVPKKEAT